MKINKKTIITALRNVLAAEDSAPKNYKKESKAEWGFDLTGIDADIWKQILKTINAQEKPTHTERKWVWKGEKVTIYTGNDPISGKYAGDNRENEVGYASYIGIEGDRELVKKVAGMIRKYGDCKDESPNRRNYI